MFNRLASIGFAIAFVMVIPVFVIKMYTIKPLRDDCSINNNTITAYCQSEMITDTILHKDEAHIECWCYYQKVYLEKPNLSRNDYDKYIIMISILVLMCIIAFVSLILLTPIPLMILNRCTRKRFFIPYTEL